MTGIVERGRRFVRDLAGVTDAVAALSARIDESRMLAAKLLIRQAADRGVLDDLRDAEFNVFSQFGDDGIIQYLVRAAAIPEGLRTFVEFGVGDYSEANTRFLLFNDNWRGLVMDPDEGNVRRIRAADWYWKHDLTAARAFVDRGNVDATLSGHGFAGEIGLLHIDIDGNDYWVWEALTAARPVVAILEYNSVLGRDRAVVVPYDPGFRRTRAHASNLYWGCSLRALCALGDRKGYAFVGSNGAGNNAYFVRRECLGAVPERTAASGYVESRYRESRDAAGRLTFVSGGERRKLIAGMPVLDLETNTLVKVGEL